MESINTVAWTFTFYDRIEFTNKLANIVSKTFKMTRSSLGWKMFASVFKLHLKWEKLPECIVRGL